MHNPTDNKMHNPTSDDKWELCTSFEDMLRSNLKFINDEITNHPNWAPGKTRNLIEESTEIRNYLTSINKLGFLTNMTQPTSFQELRKDEVYATIKHINHSILIDDMQASEYCRLQGWSNPIFWYTSNWIRANELDEEFLQDMLSLKKDDLYQKYHNLQYKQRALCQGFLRKNVIDKLLNIDQCDFMIITDAKTINAEPNDNYVSALFWGDHMIRGKVNISSGYFGSMLPRKYNTCGISMELYTHLKDEILPMEIVDKEWNRQNKNYMWAWLLSNL